MVKHATCQHVCYTSGERGTQELQAITVRDILGSLLSALDKGEMIGVGMRGSGRRRKKDLSALATVVTPTTSGSKVMPVGSGSKEISRTTWPQTSQQV